MRETGMFSGNYPFFVGANYWASHAGTFMWRNWDAEQVEKDFQLLSSNGVEVLRVFPLWSDFQKLTDHCMVQGRHYEYRYGEEPLPATPMGEAAVDPEMMERFHTLCQLAQKYGLKLIVGLLTGWMSGRLYAPQGLEHKNLLTDPDALRWEVKFIRCFVREMKNEPAIAAWDWGNECDCLAPHTDGEMWVWGTMMTLAIKAEDDSRFVVSGQHESQMGPIMNMGDAAEILTTHPYPLFSPHCAVDFIDSFRNAFHAACQTCWVSGIGGRPALVEEIGSFGPTITSERITALYLRNALWNSYAHNCHGLLWWCAHDQTELLQTPYDWNSMDRELGLVKADGTPKASLLEMKQFAETIKGIDLAPRRIDALFLPCVDGNQWGTAYITFLLAKRAGFDIKYHSGKGTIPEANLYMLPSITGTRILPRHQYLELLERVRKGATLYISSGYSGLQPFEGFGLEIESIAHADTPGRIIAPELGIDLSINRAFAMRTGACSAEIIAKDENGRAVFTVAKYGKGQLIFLAMPLESSLIDTPRIFEPGAPDYGAVYKVLMKKAGISRAVLSKDPDVTVTEHPEKEGKELKAVIVNNTPMSKTVELQFTPEYEVGSCVNGTYKCGTLELLPHSGAILFCVHK
ncbi:MAG: hypothetical protein IKB99_07130 [Lentisphaeria bacterium]|nr:hypothetical protein [Lentisphaeria bacterium]